MARVALAVLFLLVASPSAAEREPIPKDQVSFRVEAKRDVPNDWMVATLGVDVEGSEPAALAVRVNQRMAEAVKIAEAAPEIQVSSGAYQTQPVYDRGKIVRWRARQDLVVEGAKLDLVSELVGQLQAQGLALRGVSFSVAPETSERLEEELIVEALSAFRQRAGLIARGVGRRGWNLVQLTIGQPGLPMPMPMAEMRTMAASTSDEASPAFVSGKSTLRISIDATIEVE